MSLGIATLAKIPVNYYLTTSMGHNYHFEKSVEF